MKKPTILLLAGVLALFAISCNKNDLIPASQDTDLKPFLLDGIGYATLQQAVDATYKKPYDRHTISLTENATGNGAIFSDKGTGPVLLDLSTHVYTLSPGASLLVEDNTLYITGNGGGIVAAGDKYAIRGDKEGAVWFLDNVNLSGENIINSSAEIAVESSFSGKMNGNISLKETSMHIYSPACSIDVPVLTVKGKNAVFSVETPNAYSTGSISINQIASDRTYPVTSTDSRIVTVTDGKKPHIHTFEEHTIQGDCITPDKLELFCTVCGYTTYREPEERVYVKCDPSGLIKHERLEPTDFNFGNIEYYECPKCGSRYSDDEGNKSIADGVLLYPLEYEALNSLMAEADAIMKAEDEDATVVDFIFKDVPKVLNIAGKFLDTDYDTYLKALEKIGKISGNLDRISKQLNVVHKALENYAYEKRVLDRFNMLNTYAEVDTTLIIKHIYVKDGSRTPEETLRKLLLQRENSWPGFSDNVISLLLQYPAIVDGYNFPQMYATVIDSKLTWEHQGYNTRRVVMLRDAAIVSIATMFTKYYYTYVKTYRSDATREEEIKLLKDAYDKYIKTIKDESAKMNERDSLYRITNDPKVIYCRDMCHFNFKGFMENNKGSRFPFNNPRAELEHTFNRMLIYGTKLKNHNVKFLPYNVLNSELENLKKQSRSTKKDTIRYYHALTSLGFRGLPTTRILDDHNNCHWHFMCDEQRGYGKESKEQVSYRNFLLEDHEYTRNQDHIYIDRTVTFNGGLWRADFFHGNIRFDDGVITTPLSKSEGLAYKDAFFAVVSKQ